MQFVSYLRVSTRGQGDSGLGIEAQRKAVEAMARQRHGDILAEFTEVESGRNDFREELAKAIDYAQLFDAILLIANVSRLARRASFVLQLHESGVRFMCADMPDANDFTVGIMALVAQQQAKDISEATKRGLAAAKARGTTLGGRREHSHNFSDENRAKGQLARKEKKRKAIERLRPIIESIYEEYGRHVSPTVVARELNKRKVPMVSGKKPGDNGAKWRYNHAHRAIVAAGIVRGSRSPEYRPETERAPNEQSRGREETQ